MNATRNAKTYSLTKDDLRLVTMMKALGHPARMQIVRYLIANPQCITNDLVDLLPLAQATVSQHLKVLRDAGWVCGMIDGPATCYCIDPEALAWFRQQVGTLV